MLLLRQILVIALALGTSAVGLTACGQQGALYLPVQAPNAERTSAPATQPRPAGENATDASRSAPSVSKPAAPPASATP